MTTGFLYNVALDQVEDRLVETAKSRARLTESIARFNAENNKDYPGGPVKATQLQIIGAHEKFTGFGETGEFTLARKSSDQIKFLLSQRHSDSGEPKPVALDSKNAEPMRKALAGYSGVLVGLDYRGELVLAAHEPVAQLNLGLVAKIDLAEVRRPYVRAGLSITVFALLAILGGTLMISRLLSSMTGVLETHRRELAATQRLLETVFQAIPILISVKNAERKYVMLNTAASKKFGINLMEVVGRRVDEISQLPEVDVDIVSIEDEEVIRTGKPIDIPE